MASVLPPGTIPYVLSCARRMLQEPVRVSGSSLGAPPPPAQRVSGVVGTPPQPPSVRPKPDRTDPRMPGLEAGVHIALLLVDRFRVSETERG
jgi:hypothetical protein